MVSYLLDMNSKLHATHTHTIGPPNKLVRHDTLCPPGYWATAVDPKKAKNQWLGVVNALSRCPSATRSVAFREFGTASSPKKRKKKALKDGKKKAPPKTHPARKGGKKKARRN